MDIDTIYTQLTRMSLLLLLPTAAVKRRVHASIYIILLLYIYIYIRIQIHLFIYLYRNAARIPPGLRVTGDKLGCAGRCEVRAKRRAC